MSQFDKRREGFEARFALDEELRFRVEARRNKLLGHWAADEMNLTGAEKEAYAMTVVVADLTEPGEEDVFRKLREDFDDKGIAISDHKIRTAMANLRYEAREQIATSQL